MSRTVTTLDYMDTAGPAAWRTIVERAPISIMIVRVPSTDPEEIEMVYTNPVSPRVAEAARPRDDGRFVDVYPEVRDTPLPAAIIEVCERGEPRELPELLYGDARIPTACFNMHLTPLGDRHVAIQTRNLTAQRRAEEALRQVNASLEETVRVRTRSLQRINERLRRYASIAAHDLSSPLMRILNFLDLIELEVAGLSDDGRDLIHRAQDAACQLKQRVDVLLEQASDIGSALRPVPCTLDTVVTTALDKLSPLIESRAARIRRPNMLPRVMADPNAVESILINLAKNAIVHNPRRNPLVDLSAETVGGAVRLRVCDSAPTIPEQGRDKIFRLFHRLDPQATGSGIGLAISRELAEAQGGRLSIGASNEGNCFVLSLPAARA